MQEPTVIHVPHIVLSSHASTKSTKRKHSLMPVSLTPIDVDLMKFAIGLRLLGEVRRQRYLTYLRQLVKHTTQPGEDRTD